LRVLVTGGAGYIGSHTCLELLTAGHEVCVLDNLHNGYLRAIERVSSLTNRMIEFTDCDIRDGEALNSAFAKFAPESVIHFAGLKAIGESSIKPLMYYDVNVGGSIAVIAAMERAGCTNIVFSSSAAVYGDPEYLPYDEEHPTRPVNPYGRTKLMAEQIIHDWVKTTPGRRATALRYFNPIGAHVSGQIGECPRGVPNNLMPYIAQVASGRRAELNIWGNDYDTLDGTGLRDYIHVVDLALAHVAALERQGAGDTFEAINVGSGKGATVLEMVRAFEAASNKKIPYRTAKRRQGDIDKFWSNPSKAEKILGWKVKKSIEQMCQDMWRWQKLNPEGYAEKIINVVNSGRKINKKI